MKLLSIIIPMYNGAATIGRCLDSIVNQNLNVDDYEIICVDDCSPDPSQNDIVNRYIQKYNNISLLKHSVNKRQGGARNTGVDHAHGKFIAYIDQDDTFKEGSLTALAEALRENPSIDILMTTAATIDEKGVTKSLGYESENTSEIMTGSEFINYNNVPWCPWCYIYRKDFLTAINLKFVENVRLEDIDYVMHATLEAKKMRFLPIDLIRYYIYTEQTTFFGNDYNRIHDWICLSDRVGIIANNYMDKDERGAKRVMDHYLKSYNSFLRRYAWRLKYSEIKSLLSAYPPRFGNSLIINISRKPSLYASIATLARPTLNLVWRIKRLL